MMSYSTLTPERKWSFRSGLCRAVFMPLAFAVLLGCPVVSWGQEKALVEAAAPAVAGKPEQAPDAAGGGQAAPDEKMDEETASAIRSILDEAGSCGECTEKILQEFYRNP